MSTRCSGALAAAVVWALFSLVGCQASRSAQPVHPRNVVLISIDTCRPDHLGAYAAGLDTTPNIDAVARDGVLFRQVYSTNPMTLPAHTSMLTGVTPLVHGIHDNKTYRVGPSVVTLAERLHAGGLATAAFVGAFVLDAQFGLDQGFDLYDDRFRNPLGTGRGLYRERRADEVSREAIAWLEQHRREPFFLFLHYFDPHQPYESPPPFGARYAGHPYDGEIAFTDQEIGRVLDAVARFGLSDSTLLVITADHGQALGEHGEDTHSFFAYQATIRVPLIVRVPGGRRGASVDEPVSLVDVVPTILALRGMAVPSGLDGRDLSSFVLGRGGGPPARDLYFESIVPAEYGCMAVHGLVRGRWKYLRSLTTTLYDVASDPGEAHDLAQAEPDTARALGARLDGLLAAAQETGAAALRPDAQTERRLEALGYVDAGVAGGGPSRADASACLDLFTRATAGQELFVDGRFEEAAEQTRATLSQHPEYTSAHWLLGQIALEQGQFADAAEHLARYLSLVEGEAEQRGRRASRLAYDRSRAHNALGNALQALGRLDEAKAHYLVAYRLMPRFGEAAFNLGAVAESKGNHDKAARLYGAALARMPDLASARLGLGRVLRAQGRLDDARRELERARALTPNDADVYAELGEVAISQGRLQDAAASYRHALAIAPDTLTVLNALAWLYATSADAAILDGARAVELAEHAADLTQRQDPWVLDTLAAAYAAAGRFPAATETARRALTLARAERADDLLVELGARLRLYERSAPYREPVEAAGRP